MAGLLKEEGDLPEFNHEINITPFIDVMLVLLIIFMVAAPLATSTVPVQLPSSSAPVAPQPDKPVYITLQENRRLYLGEEPLAWENLPQNLAALTDNRLDTRIFIRADKNSDYGSVMELLGLLRANGYLKLGLVGLAAQ